MSAFKWSMAMLAIALLGAAVGYEWATNRVRGMGAMPNQIAAPSAAAAKGERKILYYHDPMKPDIKFDKPGKSPFMDMQLEPVYADEGADTGGIVVSGNARQSLGVRIGHVEKATMVPRVIAVGSVAYDEHAIALVQTRVAGYVTHLRVRAALDRVHGGQVLAEVTAPAWIEAEGEYLALLRSESAGDASLRAAVRQRLAVLGMPEAAILTLERTRMVPASTELVAPIDGVVTEIGLREGGNFEAGMVLFRINGTATVWVNAQVPETQARAVTAGAMVETRAAAWPEEVFKGRVETLLPQIDPLTRTIGVRIVVENAGQKLRPGMFVQSTFAGGPSEPQLWVPSEAVIATGERSVVIVSRADGSFEVVNVMLGAEAEGKTAILSGLAEGQAIVLSGQFLIDSEASLKSAINRLTASSDAPPASAPAPGPAP